MSHLYGVYRGRVVNSADPMQQGRLLIRVPALASLTDSWAPSCVSGPGAYRPNDEVLVAFEAGRADFPIVIGKLG